MLQKLVFGERAYPVGHRLHGAIRAFVDEDGDIVFMSIPGHPLWADDEEEHCMFAVRELEPGIYEQGGYNFDHAMEFYSNHQEAERNRAMYGSMKRDGSAATYAEQDLASSEDRWSEFYETTISAYGVCDNLAQVKERYAEAIAHPTNPVVISMTKLTKKNQYPEGGWRWHKWGEYIGTQDPQCEYLADEPVIEEVYVFHVYPVVPNTDEFPLVPLV